MCAEYAYTLGTILFRSELRFYALTEILIAFYVPIRDNQVSTYLDSLCVAVTTTRALKSVLQ